MSRHVPRVGFCLLVLSLLVSLGCGGQGVQRYPVSGTVTLDGKPLAKGTVYFKTVQTGALDTLPVEDGKFEGLAEKGERRVEINAYRSRTISGPMGGEVQENLIAGRFNTESTLTATVSPTAPNTYQFEVTGK